MGRLVAVVYFGPSRAPGQSYPGTIVRSGGQAMVDLKKLVDVGRWFNSFPGPPGPLYLVLVVFFILWTALSIYLFAFRRKVFAQRPAMKGMATRFGWYAIWIGVLGLLLLGVRYAAIPYFDMRIFLYLTILAALGFAGFLLYYGRVQYPKRVAEIRAFELRRKYAPARRRKRRSK